MKRKYKRSSVNTFLSFEEEDVETKEMLTNYFKEKLIAEMAINESNIDMPLDRIKMDTDDADKD